MMLVIIVPPEDVNGDLSLLPEIEADIAKVFENYSIEVRVESVVT